ncbi:MAG: hypothetical protein V3V01_02240 [Acidimicrobiales bacterium]
MRVSWFFPVGAELLRRPALWSTAVRQLFALAPNKWWRRAPFLPIPDPAYLDFRMQTAYGDSEAGPMPDDVVTYLRWVKVWPK